MAGAGAKKFPANSKLTSDDVNNYLADQVIMRFATTTARDAAFNGVGEPTLTEGMTAYIDADNSIYTYDGTNWVKMVSASTPVGMELIGSASFAGATTFDVTGFSSTYRRYRLMYDLRRSDTTGFTGLEFQVRSSTTPQTSGYYYGGAYANYLGTTAILFNGNNVGTAW